MLQSTDPERPGPLRGTGAATHVLGAVFLQDGCCGEALLFRQEPRLKSVGGQGLFKV